MWRLKSRKFWLTVAMLLGATATAIAGISVDNEVIVVIGVVCGAAAGCIYNICDVFADAHRALSEEDNDEVEAEG